LELNQEGLVEELKIPFGNWWTMFRRKIYLLNVKKVNFKNKSLKKRKDKGRAELKLNLANLKIIVYLEVLGFILAATGRILRRSS
jgi:hypothetical protein